MSLPIPLVGTIHHDRKWWQFRGKVEYTIHYGEIQLTFDNRDERDKMMMMIWKQQEREYAPS